MILPVVSMLNSKFLRHQSEKFGILKIAVIILEFEQCGFSYNVFFNTMWFFHTMFFFSYNFFFHTVWFFPYNVVFSYNVFFSIE